MKIRVLDLAERDLRAGFTFYEAQQTGVGDYFLYSMYSEIDSLLLYAGIHRGSLVTTGSYAEDFHMPFTTIWETT